MQSNAGYEDHADALFVHYESLSYEDIHARVMRFFPRTPSQVLDVGAGSGRDAAALARQGHQVTAVEPTIGFLNRAQVKHAGLGIVWVHDLLPDLANLQARDHASFDFVLLNAVWMHLTPAERNRGMATLAAICAEKAVVVMSLRHGPVPEGRRMYEVTPQETISLSAANGFEQLHSETSDSLQAQNRAAGVSWTKLVLRYCAS